MNDIFSRAQPRNESWERDTVATTMTTTMKTTTTTTTMTQTGKWLKSERNRKRRREKSFNEKRVISFYPFFCSDYFPNRYNLIKYFHNKKLIFILLPFYFGIGSFSFSLFIFFIFSFSFFFLFNRIIM